MKVSIIGGGGLVGSSTAFALQCGGVVSSICLIDANMDKALGEALDLLHGASLVADDEDSVAVRDVQARMHRVAGARGKLGPHHI